MATEAARHLVLVGMMGAGKSTTATILGQRLARPVVDLDHEIERREQCRIAALFERVGEPGFRAIESAALAAVLARAEPHVVATGGGAVLRAGNRAALAESAEVVWLRAAPETLHERVGDDPARPLLAGDALAALRQLDEQRAASYREVADVVVDVDRATVSEVVDAVLAARTRIGAR